VHGDGPLPDIEIVSSTGDSGDYVYSGRDNRALRIELMPLGGPHPHLTLVHEIGHFLDHQTLGTKNTFASVNGEIPNVMGAIAQSASIRGLMRRQGRKVANIDVWPGRRQRESIDPGNVAYLLAPQEQFSRAYTQFIVVRSGDTTMLQQLNRIRSNPLRQGLYYEYWSDEDFAAIAEALDALFRGKGWIT